MKILKCDADYLSSVDRYSQADHFQILQFELEVTYYIISRHHELIHQRCSNLEFEADHRPQASVHHLAAISQILALSADATSNCLSRADLASTVAALNFYFFG